MILISLFAYSFTLAPSFVHDSGGNGGKCNGRDRNED